MYFPALGQVLAQEVADLTLGQTIKLILLFLHCILPGSQALPLKHTDLEETCIFETRFC